MLPRSLCPSRATLLSAISLAATVVSPAHALAADNTAAALRPLATLAGGKVEVVARFDQRPANVAISSRGRIFVSQHPFAKPPVKLMELRADGTLTPYPDPAAATTPTPATALEFADVIGVRVDAEDRLWILDKGASPDRPAKLVAWDTRRERLHRVIALPPPVFQPNSFIQDLVIDDSHGFAYLADMSRGDLVGPSDPAIISVDLATGAAWRALHSHPSLQADGNDFVIDGRPVEVPGKDGRMQRPALGLNPIAIDEAAKWVYYGAMNGRAVWRVPAAALRDPRLPPAEVAAQAERFADKPACDGIILDRGGRLYVTDVNRNAIGVVSPRGEYRVLAEDPALSWPDGFALGPDGWLYATVDQLHRHPALAGGEDRSKPPFLLVRLRLD